MLIDRLEQSIIFAVCSAFLLISCGQAALTAAEHTAKAEEYIETDDLSAAKIELKNALVKDPNSMQARWMLANVALTLGNGAQAEKEARRAQELGVVPSAMQPVLVKAIFLQGDFDGVIRESAKLADGLSKSDRALILGIRGVAMLGQGHPESAERVFKEAVAVDSGASIALVGLARLHLSRGETDKARNLLEEALDSNPSSAEAWSHLGLIDLAEGNYSAAESSFSNAIGHRKYATLDIAHRALARVERDKLDEANSDLEALQNTPLKENYHVQYVKGRALFSQDKFPEAKAAFQASYASFALSPPTRFYLAVTHHRLGETEQALSLTKPLRADFPRSGNVKRLLAATHAKRSEYDAAIGLLEEQLRVEPNNPGLLRMLGMASLYAGNARPAIEYFQRVKELEPNSQQEIDELLALARVVGDLPAELEAPESPEERPMVQQVQQTFSGEFLDAVADVKKNEFEEALRKAQALLERDPDNITTLHLITACYIGLRQFDDAKATMEKVLDIQPNELNAGRNLAKVEASLGNLDRAGAIIRGVAKAHPDDEEAVLLLARLEEQMGTQADGIRVLEQAMERNPNAPPAVRQELATQYLRAGRHLDVIALGGNLTGAQLRAEPELLQSVGVAHLHAGGPVSASRVFETLVQVQPDSAHARFLLANSLARSGNRERGREQLQRAVELDPAYLPARIGQVQALALDGETAAAKAALARMETDFGERAEVTGLGGLVAFVGRDFTTAEERFRKAADEQPSTAMTLLYIQSLIPQGKHMQAIEVMKEWLGEHPGDVDVHELLVGTYLHLNREADAIAEYERVLEIYPQYRPALNNIAWYLRTRDRKRALEYAERARELAPQDPQVLDTLGTILLASGIAEQKERGLGLLRQAASFAAGDPEIQLRFGRALVSEGQYDEARKLLETLIQQHQPASSITAEAEALLASIPAETLATE